jgi:hypothetical protein
MMVDSLATLSPNVADLSLEYIAPITRRRNPLKETVWLSIEQSDEPKELISLERWFQKNFPNLRDTDEPVLIKPPRGKDMEAKLLVEIINRARVIKHKAACYIIENAFGVTYPILSEVRELKQLMKDIRKDPREKEVPDFHADLPRILKWVKDLEYDYSRKFIQLKAKDGVGIRGNLTEIAEWGTAGVMDVEGLDQYPMFIEAVRDGKQSDAMYLGILMHYLPKVVFDYIQRNVDQPQLVDTRVKKLLSWKDLKLNEVFLPEAALMDPAKYGSTGWQGYLPAPLDAVTRKDAERFYKDFELNPEETSLRVGLIFACLQALSATINAEIEKNIEDPELKYRSMMDIRNIISRNFSYVLAAIENIIYFFEKEIGFKNAMESDIEFETRSTLYMRFVSPYKYSIMSELDQVLQRFDLRFATRVGISMRADMIIHGEKTTIIDFKSTIHYDGTFQDKIKPIGYVLAAILKKIWGGTFSKDADSFIISKINFNQDTIAQILAELKNYEFYYWGMNGDKVIVEITDDDMMQFLKLTKLYTQCKISSKTPTPKDERELLIALWLPDESHNKEVSEAEALEQ